MPTDIRTTRCLKCGAYFGWHGTDADRPACPKCKDDPEKRRREVVVDAQIAATMRIEGE